MTMHELESNKIQEASVTSPYLDNGGAQYILPTIKKLEGKAASHKYLMFDTSRTIGDWTKPLTPRVRYKSQDEESLVLHKMAQLVANVAPARNVDLGQLWLRQLLRRLRKFEESKIADRIEYLTSEEIAEDGGDIPTTASIASFVTLYFDNRDLGEPLLGATPNGELQAVWELSGRRRLVAEFLDDDIVKYVYRRAGNVSSPKLFTMGRQPRHKIRGILENVSI